MIKRLTNGQTNEMSALGRFLPFLLFLSFGLWAKEIKIGYIDSERIFKEYEAASEAKTSFNEEVSKYTSKADTMKRELQKVEEEYEAQKPMLSEEARAAKEQEIASLHQRFTEFTQNIWGERGKLVTKQKELLGPIVKKINEAVRKMAQKEGYAIILDLAARDIIYAEPGLDISKEVIKELNKEYRPALALRKKKIAAFPLFEKNKEAVDERLGRECLDIIYAKLGDLEKARTDVRLIYKGDVENALSSRSITNVDEIKAKEIGRTLDADYIFTGTVEKKGDAINLELTLSEPKIDKDYPTKSGKAEKKELLKETLLGLFQGFLTHIEK